MNMNGFNRHTKYRQGVYRRQGIKTVILTTAVVLLLVLVTLLILGSILAKKSSLEEDTQTKEEQTVTETEAPLAKAPPVKALPVLLETAGSETLNARLGSVTSQGYTAASVPLNKMSGSYLYHSELLAPLGLSKAGEYSVTLANAVRLADERGVYLCGTYCLTDLSLEDELLRSVALSKSAAMIAEAMGTGVREVLLVLPDLTEEQIPDLLGLASSVRALAPDGLLGCAIPPNLFESLSAEESVRQISEGFHFLALDLTRAGEETPKEYLDRIMGRSGTLFYLLRYEMRMLLPQVTEEGGQDALCRIAEENWTGNWQILSGVVFEK